MQRWGYDVGQLDELVHLVSESLRSIAQSERGKIILPVGILLVLGKEHGGDASAKEVIKRFNLLDKRSDKYINFYY